MIEMIVVIVVMSILSIGVIGFIMDSSAGYVQTAARNQLSATGRVTIDKMAMELRNALPNSVRTSSSNCVEFVPVLAASSYMTGTGFIHPPFEPEDATEEFEVASFMPAPDLALDLYAVIYPHNTEAVYDGSKGARAVVTNVVDLGGGLSRVEMASHVFAKRSPFERVFLVSGPVSFCLHGTNLYRYANYAYSVTQPFPGEAGFPDSTASGRALVGDSITAASFNFLAASRRRNGIVQMQLTVSNGSESIQMNHEVMLQSVP